MYIIVCKQLAQGRYLTAERPELNSRPRKPTP